MPFTYKHLAIIYGISFATLIYDQYPLRYAFWRSHKIVLTRYWPVFALYAISAPCMAITNMLVKFDLIEPDGLFLRYPIQVPTYETYEKA